MKQLRDLQALPTPAELRQWREGYRHHLEAHGIPPENAADMAARVAYRADLYPTGDAQPFELVPPPTEARPAKKTARPAKAE